MRSIALFSFLKNRVGNVIILLLLCFLVVTSINYGRANIAFYSAKSTIDYWQNGSGITNINEYQQSIFQIQQAKILHSNNSHYLITSGLINEWAATSELFDENQRTGYLTLAEEDYIAAVENRPTWPVTWATLAILKWRLDEIDEEMVNYLNNAYKYGPNRLEVNQAWVDLGFYIYHAKSPFSPKVINGLRLHFKQMAMGKGHGFRQSLMKIVARHGVEKLACQWISNYNFDVESLKRAWCRHK
ncbi:MAG: VpsP family polysaccharide biosynthesis protein [Colwellia sp.]